MNLHAYVKEHGIKKLASTYAITVIQSREHPSLYLFKYSQLNSPFNLAVRECRGTILDADNDWAIVSFPYEKFFNYGESNAAQIDWRNGVKVTEKTDGSLMILYWYKNEWRVGSSGIPDGTGKILLNDDKNKDDKDLYLDEDGDERVYFEEENSLQASAEDRKTCDLEEEDRKTLKTASNISHTEGKLHFTTFRELFWKVWNSQGYQLPSKEDRDKCFMFELCE
eukprot:TRINITY_DN4421_c0_g2_i1.p1 TRINITY_DN4421_c0_g2~~TRINITY_DN4421_c0_g2_i1.p1  ORF type:complete len:224 (-),score=44.47 TRINITY_DN4421_c0_g2_i1:687-1358(-)